MRLRSVLAGIVAATAAAGCGGGPPKVEETALKISYYRSIMNPQTKKREPVYRVVMSESWRDMMGESPREPFPKAAGRGIYVGYLSDRDMQKYVGLLRQFGIEKLTPREPESFDPAELQRMASDISSQHLVRVITVGSDEGHRSYHVRDQVQGDQSKIFLKCEAFVSRVVEYSLQIRTGAQPFMPGRR